MALFDNLKREWFTVTDLECVSINCTNFSGSKHLVCMLYNKLFHMDKALIEDPAFEEFWHRDVKESIRQRSVKPFVEEAMLPMSNWPFSLADLQVQKKCRKKGLFDSWFKFMRTREQCELVGFLEPLHVWQGMDDLVVPPLMTDYVARVLPNAIVHRLPDHGHFWYFYFCNECHWSILSTLFGSPQGPIELGEQDPLESYVEEEEEETVDSS